MKPKIILCLALVFGAGGIWLPTPASGATVPAQTSDALAWYDTLGFPDATNLPYVRVSTGRWTQSGNQPRENRFVEGFLVGEESKAFSVFICYVPDYRTLRYMGDAATALTTVRFVRKPDGPAYSRVEYQVLELEKAASETLQRGRDQVAKPDSFFSLDWRNRALGYQTRVFALGRACLQNGLSDTGLALMNFAGNVVDVSDEVQNKGEKQVLTDAAALGGQPGCTAARMLVEKYPDGAMPTIETGFRATSIDGVRRDYVKAAAQLPGDVPMPFLKSSLTLDNGPFTRMYAAEALNARGDPEAVTAMIEAWQKFQPTLASYMPDAAGQDLTGTLYDKAGTMIAFLANSGNAAAIDALGHDLQKTPVGVRLAAVQVFLPFGNMSLGATGLSVNTEFGDGITKLSAGSVGASVERLLVSELDDSGRRVGMQGDIGDASFKDPRVCDMAALVLSKRWPDNYHFHWTANAAECAAQIAKLRDRWRSENGPSAQPQ